MSKSTKNYPRLTIRFTALFLTLVLSLPSPAFALRPEAGLEEQKPEIKQQFLSALGVSPLVTSAPSPGLEEHSRLKERIPDALFAPGRTVLIVEDTLDSLGIVSRFLNAGKSDVAVLRVPYGGLQGVDAEMMLDKHAKVLAGLSVAAIREALQASKKLPPAIRDRALQELDGNGFIDTAASEWPEAQKAELSRFIREECAPAAIPAPIIANIRRFEKTRFQTLQKSGVQLKVEFAADGKPYYFYPNLHPTSYSILVNGQPREIILGGQSPIIPSDDPRVQVVGIGPKVEQLWQWVIAGNESAGLKPAGGVIILSRQGKTSDALKGVLQDAVLAGKKVLEVSPGDKETMGVLNNEKTWEPHHRYEQEIKRALLKLTPVRNAWKAMKIAVPPATIRRFAELQGGLEPSLKQLQADAQRFLPSDATLEEESQRDAQELISTADRLLPVSPLPFNKQSRVLNLTIAMRMLLRNPTQRQEARSVVRAGSLIENKKIRKMIKEWASIMDLEQVRQIFWELLPVSKLELTDLSNELIREVRPGEVKDYRRYQKNILAWRGKRLAQQEAAGGPRILDDTDAVGKRSVLTEPIFPSGDKPVSWTDPVRFRTTIYFSPKKLSWKDWFWTWFGYEQESPYLKIRSSVMEWAAAEKQHTDIVKLIKDRPEATRQEVTAAIQQLISTPPSAPSSTGLEEGLTGSVVGVNGKISYSIYPHSAQIGDILARRISDGLDKAHQRGHDYILALPRGATFAPTIRAVMRLRSSEGKDPGAWKWLRILLLNDYVNPKTNRNISPRNPNSAVAQILKMFRPPKSSRSVIGRDQVWVPEVGKITELFNQIRRLGGVDLMLFAVGPDGSVGHNFPPEEGFQGDAVARPFDRDQIQPIRRSYLQHNEAARQSGYGVGFTLADLVSFVELTPESEVAFVATGKSKQKVMAEFAKVRYSDKRFGDLPIYFLWESGVVPRTHLYLDRKTGVGLLSGILQDPLPASPNLRWVEQEDAASDLGRIGPPAAPAVQSLIIALKSAHPSVREEAAGALGRIGPSAAAAVSDLVAIVLKESDPQKDSQDAQRRIAENEAGVRPEAVKALSRIGGRKAMIALARALNDENNNEVQIAAASGLAGMGPMVFRVLPNLGKVLSSTSSQVRRAAAIALERILEAFPKQKMELKRRLKLEEGNGLNPSRFNLKQTLETRTADHDPFVSSAARRILKQLGFTLGLEEIRDKFRQLQGIYDGIFDRQGQPNVEGRLGIYVPTGEEVFLHEILPAVGNPQVVSDLGCGPGVFVSMLAVARPDIREIRGMDGEAVFVREAETAVRSAQKQGLIQSSVGVAFKPGDFLTRETKWLIQEADLLHYYERSSFGQQRLEELLMEYVRPGGTVLVQRLLPLDGGDDQRLVFPALFLDSEFSYKRISGLVETYTRETAADKVRRALALIEEVRGAWRESRLGLGPGLIKQLLVMEQNLESHVADAGQPDLEKQMRASRAADAPIRLAQRILFGLRTGLEEGRVQPNPLAPFPQGLESNAQTRINDRILEVWRDSLTGVPAGPFRPPFLLSVLADKLMGYRQQIRTRVQLPDDLKIKLTHTEMDLLTDIEKDTETGQERTPAVLTALFRYIQNASVMTRSGLEEKSHPKAKDLDQALEFLKGRSPWRQAAGASWIRNTAHGQDPLLIRRASEVVKGLVSALPKDSIGSSPIAVGGVSLALEALVGQTAFLEPLFQELPRLRRALSGVKKTSTLRRMESLVQFLESHPSVPMFSENPELGSVRARKDLIEVFFGEILPRVKSNALVVIGPGQAERYSAYLKIFALHAPEKIRNRIFVLTQDPALVQQFSYSLQVSVNPDDLARGIDEFAGAQGIQEADFYGTESDRERLQTAIQARHRSEQDASSVILIRKKTADLAQDFLRQITASLMQAGLEDTDWQIDIDRMVGAINALAQA